ncbi:hypothetical protein HDU88_002681 [Geranomyces variabilis]|nr:hypothetical protein HDU88_002681 [Geranomyces variabilis]
MDLATAWNRHSAVYQSAVQNFTTLFGLDAIKLARIPKASRCLDIACGPGALSIYLASRGHHVFGTDISEAMLEIARTESKNSNVKVDYEDLSPFQDESFDVALSNFGIFMFPQREHGWKAAHRVLKKGGILVATGWDATFPVLVALNAFRRRVDPNVVIQDNPTTLAATFAAEVKNNGFTDVTIYPITHEFVYESGKDFLRSCEDNPFFAMVMDSDVNAARRIFLETALGTAMSKDVNVLESPEFRNPVHFKAVANVCVASKL